MNLKSIITISGRICSGKSYAANLIKNEFGFPVGSFGGYLKHYNENKGLPIDRKTLQDMGETFVNTNPKLFLNDVLSYYTNKDNNIVLEGVRHKSIFQGVSLLTQNHIGIYIDADIETRYNRYYNRAKTTDEIKTFDQFLISDSHSVEMEIESLKPQCKFIADSTQDYSSRLFEFILGKLKA